MAAVQEAATGHRGACLMPTTVLSPSSTRMGILFEVCRALQAAESMVSSMVLSGGETSAGYTVSDTQCVSHMYPSFCLDARVASQVRTRHSSLASAPRQVSARNPGLG